MSLGLNRRHDAVIRKRVKGKSAYRNTTNLFIVTFCRQYGDRHVEPFEVRAETSTEAVESALQKRWNSSDDKRHFDGRIVHDDESEKIVFVGNDGTRVNLSGRMRIVVSKA